MLDKGSGNDPMMGLMSMLLKDKLGGGGGGGGGGNWNAGKKMVGGGGPKDQLVQKVKNFQKSSPDNKQMWYSFCETQPLGKYDPSLYEPNVLKMFLNSVGVM